LTENQFYVSQNALKLICSNVEFQKIFPGVTPKNPSFNGRGTGPGGAEGGKEGKERRMR